MNITPMNECPNCGAVWPERIDTQAVRVIDADGAAIPEEHGLACMDCDWFAREVPWQRPDEEGAAMTEPKMTDAAENLPVDWVELIQERDRYRAALRKIAEMDYRGNRTVESRVAYEALSVDPGRIVHPGGTDPDGQPLSPLAGDG